MQVVLSEYCFFPFIIFFANHHFKLCNEFKTERDCELIWTEALTMALSLPPLYTVFSGRLGLGEGTALLAGEDSAVLTVPWSLLIQDTPLLHRGCHHTGPCPCVWGGESGCLSPFPGGWLRFAYGTWWNGAPQEGGPRPIACTFLGDPGSCSPLDYSWWERSWGRCSGCHFCKSHIVLTRHDIFDIKVKYCGWPCMPPKS